MEEKCPMTESPPTTPSLTSGGRFNKIEEMVILFVPFIEPMFRPTCLKERLVTVK